MAIPALAQIFEASMDPADEVDWVLDFSDLLEPGEQVLVYTLELMAEAIALGLEIMTGGDRDHQLIESDTALLFWLRVADGYKLNVAFDGQGGTTLPIVVTIITNSVPARTRQRTALVRVVQQ